MCGIGAIIQKPSSLPYSVVEKFNTAISHRGPDGEGYAYFPAKVDGNWNVALAHRRLSIIDLSETGKQPMSYQDENLWIIFNGEIYNYLEVRDELRIKGHAFDSTSDTEVILAAYLEWGTAAFEKLRGMWGLILYDCKRGKVIASRDRMGIKPLYYFKHGNYIAFASEIKQFLILPDFITRPNKAVVRQYLLTGFERTDRTFFQDVIPLLPGTFMEVDVESLRTGAQVSYWNPGGIAPSIKDRKEAAELFKNDLDESVRIHLRSDVPVGCQLSGGVDSSAVFALMQQYYTGESIHSFTVQFPGYEKDETPFVNKMLEGSNAKPHFVTPHAIDFMGELRNFVWHHDEPVGSFAHYAGFVLARLIAENKIKVVLNGQGGDEILGGYWQQYYSYLFSMGKRGGLAGVLGHFAGALGGEGNEEMVKQIPFMLRRYRSRNRKQPFQLTKPFANEPSLHFFDSYFSMSAPERRVFEVRNLILPRLLKWDDRNLMAYGVEGRYPFLDHKVIETALSFDAAVLFKNGWTKYPLRMAVKDRIPREIYFRKSKWGFEVPQQHWLSEALRPMLSDWVKSDKPLDDVIVPENIIALASQFWKTGNQEDGQSLFRLFLMDQWLRVFSIRI